MTDTQPPTPAELQAQLTEMQGRLADAEAQTREAELGTLRARIAGEHGIKTEYLDFLTATDEATLQHQAERLVALGGGQTSQALLGNVAPREGATTVTHSKNSPREVKRFVNELFDRDPDLNYS
ncbi:hypothetical protein H489_0108265 [Curtobacterium flaccumfaciens UCD-AKU]|uniref:hypothetical protein n=1 Tax=Curtobacterium flaccumfaciens TaxID=2035 RepID=UPI000372F5B1|nr:hypothetical protein [Curtobacterium flaccumfaciens]EYT64802.1 hypothetical protein H489_0108265 [Curtobacterium flaccumfaciens UCD-AKU]